MAGTSVEVFNTPWLCYGGGLGGVAASAQTRLKQLCAAGWAEVWRRCDSDADIVPPAHTFYSEQSFQRFAPKSECVVSVVEVLVSSNSRLCVGCVTCLWCSSLLNLL